MNNFINCSKKVILVKDMSDVIDFNLICEEFNKLKFVRNVENDISDDKNFFNKENLTETKKLLEDECKQFLYNALEVENFTDLKITNSWGNITKTNESHHIHKHPFSVISAVLFLDNNSENFNLHLEYILEKVPYFIEKQDTYLPISILIEQMGINVDDVNNLKNHLVLFSSSTGHFVSKIDSDSDRRTISFNTFWSGVTGVQGLPLMSMNF